MTHFTQHFIGGRRVAPHKPNNVEIRSPFDGELVGSAPLASVEDINLAVAAARRSFDTGPWAKMSPENRISAVKRFFDLYEQRAEEFALLVSREMGAPLWFARNIQSLIRNQSLAFLEAAASYPWEQWRQGFPDGNSLWVREPVGVVAAIVPWNAPHQVALAKLYPALLAGCSVILKLAPETALDGQFLGEIFTEAGLPEGVLSILAADRDVSEHLITHPGVDKIGFTGSTGAGRRIASLAGERLKRVSLELGGKSAAIVLPDADLTDTINALRYRSFPNNGQVCVAQTRVLVPKQMYSDFTDAMVADVANMTVGDPTDPDTFIGPVISERQRQRVLDYIRIGVQEGATVAIGGEGMPDGLNHGTFVKPTVFTNTDNSMRIAREEIFGPVVCLIPYDRVDQAIEIANDSDYGLSGSVWTSNAEEGLRIARQIRTGGIVVNGAPSDLLAPFGGFKQSGIGREFGSEGISHYIEHKTISI
ncbi:aldehyde dehydrogenase [Ochrobactrum sp. SFR4]|uniref:aldehyde dehydrogenase n=1 Tax=Ochrobactrum sp. SFR4 TaxID=2717368 RepID=UPI000EFA42BC|nr:aldehyde dehydrogenase [Ochrobactrum sp. SFR4]MBX8827406.1 aldehyde dehydrogenase [Ochrobactrum sp. SFR4]